MGARGYGHIEATVAAGRCVILDGGIGTELPDPGIGGEDDHEALWGIRALLDAPADVLDVHRAYVRAGCDVVSTNTWGLPTALLDEGPRLWDDADGASPVHWMDVARQGLRLARDAVREERPDGSCAVAFSLNGDVDTEEGDETIRLLSRLFADEPPDLVLLETLSVLRPSLNRAVERLLDTGVPLWLSFRRCRQGMCGVYGQHWGGPEGDAFGRSARRFEELGVGALLINCIPPDHVDGMVSYLRDFTDLPLGVYPNLGYFTSDGWRFDSEIGGEAYGRMAQRWREEGAQVIGGCCGVGPGHIAAARAALADSPAGGVRRAAPALDPVDAPETAVERAAAWEDQRDRPLYPLPFPDLVTDPGVAPPGDASYVLWKYLFRSGVGAHQRCLDVGCGTGLQTVALALNGAAHVHAIDIDGRAVSNTLTNAFRNGVADRVTAAAMDLRPWVPEERYEVIVASLDQVPTDPFGPISMHRPVDYWGRGPFDQLIEKLRLALAPEGVAYVLQLSLLSQRRTAALLARSGLEVEVVDFALFDFPASFEDRRTQVRRVEERSDAFHVEVGDQQVMVAYVLEIRRSDGTWATGIP